MRRGAFDFTMHTENRHRDGAAVTPGWISGAALAVAIGLLPACGTEVPGTQTTPEETVETNTGSTDVAETSTENEVIETTGEEVDDTAIEIVAIVPTGPNFAERLAQMIDAQFDFDERGNAFTAKPAGNSGFQTAQVAGSGAQRPGDTSAADVAFIVMIKDEELIANVARKFRREPDAARAAFQAWAGQNGWEGFSLEGASYSGELILRLSPDAPPALQERFRSTPARDMANELAARPGVSYSDPDYTAGTGRD